MEKRGIAHEQNWVANLPHVFDGDFSARYSFTLTSSAQADRPTVCSFTTSLSITASLLLVEQLNFLLNESKVEMQLLF